MGDAKRRGTYEERVAQAKERQKVIKKVEAKVEKKSAILSTENQLLLTSLILQASLPTGRK